MRVLVVKVVLFLLLLLPVGFCWWNENWWYRKAIIITERSGNTLTDYQVAINVTYDSGMQPDFDDLRFTYYNSTSDSETEIPYWIEDIVLPYNLSVTAYYQTGTNCLSANDTGWNEFPTSGWNVRNGDWYTDNWDGCDYCDYYAKIVMDLEYDVKPDVKIEIKSDDGQWLWVNEQYVGHCGGGCHGDGICTNTWDITSYLSEGSNEIRIWCSDWEYGEYCEFKLLVEGEEIKQNGDYQQNLHYAYTWIKVPEIPANGNATVYMYYGNPSATSESNGTAVFEFFDDFEDGIFDSSKWVMYHEDGITEANGVLNLSDVGDYSPHVKSKQLFDLPVVLKTRAHFPSRSCDVGLKPQNWFQLGDGAFNWYTSDEWRLTVADSGVYTYKVLGTPQSGWFVDELKVNNTGTTATARLWRDCVYKGSVTGPIGSTSLAIDFHICDNQKNLLIDWVFIRKYADPEPTVTIPTWYYSDWLYRRPITITEQSGNTLTDFQVAINITYDSNMQTDFDDLRFTYYNGNSGTESEIPYWIEDKVDGSWAYVWIKVPEIPANGNATVYMYYGNPSATSNQITESDMFYIVGSAESTSVGTSYFGYTISYYMRTGTYVFSQGKYKTRWWKVKVNEGSSTSVKIMFARTDLAPVSGTVCPGTSASTYIINTSPTYHSVSGGQYVDEWNTIYEELVVDCDQDYCYIGTITPAYAKIWNDWGPACAGQKYGGEVTPDNTYTFDPEDYLQPVIRVCFRKFADPDPTYEIGAEEMHLKYRIPIVIDNTANSNTLTDYQILVTLDTQSLIYQGKLRSDCGDIRFTNSTSYNSGNWTISYPYWLESGCNTSNTRIWVKIDSIPASSNKTIYMYYGNPLATSESNGTAVFDFFDDFSEDLSKWTVTHGTDFSIENETLKVIKTATSNPGDVILADVTTDEGIIEYNIMPENNSPVGPVFWSTSDAGDFWAIGPVPAENYTCVNHWVGDGFAGGCQDPGPLLRNYGTWDREKLVFTSDGKVKFYYGDKISINTSGKSPRNGSIGIWLSWSQPNATAYFDNFRLRKYADPEPSIIVGTVQVINLPLEINSTNTNLIDDNFSTEGTFGNVTFLGDVGSKVCTYHAPLTSEESSLNCCYYFANHQFYNFSSSSWVTVATTGGGGEACVVVNSSDFVYNNTFYYRIAYTTLGYYCLGGCWRAHPMEVYGKSKEFTYSYGGNYTLESLVCSPYSIDTVLLEFQETNYTVVNESTYNQSCTIYNATLSNLSAGTYNATWYANNTVGVSTIKDFNFTIAKATPALSLFLDGRPYNKYVTYPEQTNATAYESNEGDSDVTYCLYRDDTLVGCGSSVQEITTLSPAIYTYTYNSTEGQNYTSASISRTLGVLSIEPIIVSISDVVKPGILWWTMTPITITEGEYYQMRCSEWGDNNTRCYTECPDCYAEIGHKVRWRKSVVIYNPSSVTYEQVLVNASIPASTCSESDVKIESPDGDFVDPYYVNISAGEVRWLVPSIDAGESQTWVIYFNTTPPTLEKANATAETVWYLYVNVTGPSDLTYEKIWTYTQTYEPLTLQKLYDYETGSYVTTDTEWGPPQPRDIDGDGFYDWYQWITPSVTGNRSLRLEGIMARVFCKVVNKTILNLPVTPNENVEWKWVVQCRNDADIGLNYEWVLRLPLESQYVKVDGTPVEVGFYTLPPAGPYITLSGYLAAGTAVNRTVTFISPPVTVEISPPRFPGKFWVGKNASIAVEISARNWASEAVNQTKVRVNIVYGTDVKLYRDGRLVNETDEVWGYYTFYIYNMSGYETRNYVLTYQTPVADSELGRYSRAVINNTQYLVYPVHTWSLAPFPLDPLYQRFEHEEPFSCKDVAFVWGGLTKETYTNPLTASYYTELDFECEDNETVVELLPLSVGEDEYFAIFVVEEERPAVPLINKVIFDFFENLIGAVRGLIDALISLLTSVVPWAG